MKSYFNVYEETAKLSDNATLINGRYSIQSYAEQFILTDVIKKLEVNEKDTVIDIGCGKGILTFGLCCIAGKMIGIDNATVIGKLKTQYVPSNVTLLVGDWMDIEVTETYTKVVIYSVAHYLKNLDVFFLFVDKALRGLPENGEILVGDIPNVDKKRRFLNSAAGKVFDEKFRREKASWSGAKENVDWDEITSGEETLEETIVFDDTVIEAVMRHYHNLSCDVYILPQKGYLPFGHTREDLLIVKRGMQR